MLVLGTDGSFAMVVIAIIEGYMADIAIFWRQSPKRG